MLRKYLAALMALVFLFAAQASQFALAAEVQDAAAEKPAVNVEPKAEPAPAEPKPDVEPKPVETGGDAPRQEESAPAVKPTPEETSAPATAPATEEATPNPTEAITPEPTAPSDSTAPDPSASPEPSQEPSLDPSASPDPTESATPEASESPEPTASPQPLSAQLRALSSYGYAHSEAISVQLHLSGGVAPYTVQVQGCEGGATAESVYSVSAEGNYTYAYMPTRYGNCTVRVIVTDALGQTAGGAVCVPVAARDGGNGSEFLKRAAALQRSGDWVADLLAVAASQIGYQESKTDYRVDADGKIQGYTIYGAWYGVPYTEWCAMFVSWSMNQAGIPSSAFPYEAGCQKMMNALAGIGVYEDDEDAYAPKPGDVVFFNWDSERDPDHVGIVEQVSEEQVFTIEGNSGRQVRRRSYARSDGSIMGYANMEKVMLRAGVLATVAPEEPANEADAMPAIAAAAQSIARAEGEIAVTPSPTLVPDPVAIDIPKAAAEVSATDM